MSLRSLAVSAPARPVEAGTMRVEPRQVRNACPAPHTPKRSVTTTDATQDRLAERRQAAAFVFATFAVMAVSTVVLAAPFGLMMQALALGVGGMLTFFVLRSMLRRASGTPILVYHSISQDADWLPWANEISIRPESFDRHLCVLQRMGMTTMDTAEFSRLRIAQRAVPENLVLLHIDDGYLDTRVAAWPILQKYGACATLFVSTDFIAPDQPLRPTLWDDGPVQWDGYLSWAEIRALDATPEIAVEAHGTDHGRVPLDDGSGACLTQENRGQMAWMQWAKMHGNKHDWYRRVDLLVPVGTPIPTSAPALAARAWCGGQLENEASYHQRVSHCLETSVSVLSHHLNRSPELFCWPQNATNSQARALAMDAGFVATTGGRGRNTAQEDPRVLSRVHAGEDYGGFRCGWIDDLALRAHLRCFQGDLIWAPVLVLIGALKRSVKACQDLNKGAQA